MITPDILKRAQELSDERTLRELNYGVIDRGQIPVGLCNLAEFITIVEALPADFFRDLAYDKMAADTRETLNDFRHAGAPG